LLRRTFLYLLLAVAVLALGVEALRDWWLPGPGRAWLERAASEALDGELRIGGSLELLLSTSRPGLAARDVQLTRIPSHPDVPEIRAQDLSLRVSLWKLLGGEFSIETLDARAAEVTIPESSAPASSPRAFGAEVAGVLEALPPDIQLRNLRVTWEGRSPAADLVVEEAAWGGCGGKLRIIGSWAGHPLELDTQAHCPNSGVLALEALEIALGESDLHGQLRLDARSVPAKLSGTLDAETLVFADFTAGPASEPQAAPDPTDTALPRDLLHDLDLDVSLAARNLHGGGRDFTQLRAQLENTQGTSTLRLESLEIWNGELAGVLTVKANQTPATLDLSLHAEHLDLSIPLEGSGGRAYASLKLAARGDSLSDALASSAGELRFLMDETDLEGDPLGPLGQDLFGMIFTGLRDDQSGKLSCTVVRAEIHEGVGRTQVVLDTPKTVVAGIGEVDLAQGEVDIVLHPAPHNVSVGTIQTPIRVSGEFGNLHAALDVSRTAKQFGEAGLLFFANPLLAVLPFVNLGSGSDPCHKALASERIQALRKGNLIDHATQAATDSVKGLTSDVREKPPATPAVGAPPPARSP